MKKEAILVDIDAIKPLQTFVSEKKLNTIRGWMKKDTIFNITCIERDGIWYISNGHHRAYVAKELGFKQIYVHRRSPGNTDRLFKRQREWCKNIEDMKIMSHPSFQKYIKQ